jgi:hypothetical protein
LFWKQALYTIGKNWSNKTTISTQASSFRQKTTIWTQWSQNSGHKLWTETTIYSERFNL